MHVNLVIITSRPEQAEGHLEDPGEESHCEDERPVGRRVGGRVDDVLDHRRQQQRDHGDGADGDLPRRPHDSVDQRRHNARVFQEKTQKRMCVREREKHSLWRVLWRKLIKLL